jgi:hypothetical protein
MSRTSARSPLIKVMIINVPAAHRGCSVYLFDKIPISRVADPFSAKNIELTTLAGSSRKLSFNDLFKLPTDQEGYHLLNIPK